MKIIKAIVALVATIYVISVNGSFMDVDRINGWSSDSVILFRGFSSLLTIVLIYYFWRWALSRKGSSILGKKPPIKPPLARPVQPRNNVSPSDKPKAEKYKHISHRQDKFFEKALLEYESGSTAKNVYARAIVEADGNHTREKSAYIKLRVDDLEKSYVKYLRKKREEVWRIENQENIRKTENKKAENKKQIMDKLYKRLGDKDNSSDMVNKLLKTLSFLGYSIESERLMFDLRDTNGKIVKTFFSPDEIIKSIENLDAHIICPKCNYTKSIRYDKYKEIISSTIICPKCKSHIKIDLPNDIF